MGIRSDRALSYRKSRDGVDRMYAMAESVVESACMDESFDEILKEFSKDERNK